ncbi:TonB-dependent receptor [Adhaeribacter aquaticus]|uniref:TonB-dependent receptor n=1 Tax=Adhaeribacter aquaticus TaxID=299567 RepID=UPI000683E8D5|nr:TonB-dependent receptor [Adhaeribacter aquaticus]
MASAQSIRGRILDADTKAPLPSVTVVLLHTTLGTVSNQEGYFEIYTKTPGNYKIRITRVGYEPLDLNTTTDQTLMEVALKPTFLQLNKAVVITAQRYETNQFNRPEAISVITQKELDQRAPRSTPEALMGTTGVWMQKTNHGGGSPFIRGLTGQQTLLLIDGIRLNNATFRSGPNQYLNTIDPQNISQIEILRGSGSVQYGSDAMGGVAQILTKNPVFTDSLSVNGSVYGKYMSAGMEKSGRAEVSVSNTKVAFLGGLAYRSFGDLVAGGDLGVQKPTGYDQISGDLKAKIRLSERYLFTAAWQKLEQKQVPVFHKVQLENFAYNYFDPQRRQLTYARLEAFHNNPWFRKVTLTGSLQQTLEGRKSQKNDSPILVSELDKVNTWGAVMAIDSEPTSYWKAHSGIEYYYDQVNSTREDINLKTDTRMAKRGLYPNGSTASNLALFSLHTLELDKFVLSAGGRFNAFDITVKEKELGASTIRPSALVGSFSALYKLHPHHHLVSSVNTSFRAPNIDDLGTLGIVDFRYEVPNTSLKPEKALNMELGWKARTKRFSSQVAFFRSNLSNIIGRVRSGNDSIQGYQVYLKENVAEAYLKGLEADAEWQLAPTLAAYGNLVYTYGQNITAQEPLRRIPPLHGKLGLSYRARQGIWIQPQYMFAAKQSRLAQGDIDDNRIANTGTPAWSLLNLNAGYSYRWFSVSMELHNIRNKAYRTHGSGVDGYGRSFWLATQIRF